MATPSSVRKPGETFFDKQTFSDVVVWLSNGKQIFAHRVKLADASPYFGRLLTPSASYEERRFYTFIEIDFRAEDPQAARGLSAWTYELVFNPVEDRVVPGCMVPVATSVRDAKTIATYLIALMSVAVKAEMLDLTEPIEMAFSRTIVLMRTRYDELESLVRQMYSSKVQHTEVLRPHVLRMYSESIVEFRKQDSFCKLLRDLPAFSTELVEDFADLRLGQPPRVLDKPASGNTVEPEATRTKRDADTSNDQTTVAPGLRPVSQSTSIPLAAPAPTQYPAQLGNQPEAPTAISQTVSTPENCNPFFGLASSQQTKTEQSSVATAPSTTTANFQQVAGLGLNQRLEPPSQSSAANTAPVTTIATTNPQAKTGFTFGKSFNSDSCVATAAPLAATETPPSSSLATSTPSPGSGVGFGTMVGGTLIFNNPLITIATPPASSTPVSDSSIAKGSSLLFATKPQTSALSATQEVSKPAVTRESTAPSSAGPTTSASSPPIPQGPSTGPVRSGRGGSGRGGFARGGCPQGGAGHEQQAESGRSGHGGRGGRDRGGRGG